MTGVGLASGEEDCDDERLCSGSGKDLGMAGGSEGRTGAAVEADDEAPDPPSAKTLKSDQSTAPEEDGVDTGGGDGDGVRGGGV